MKYEFGAGTVKYKLGSGARAGGREAQIPKSNGVISNIISTTTTVYVANAESKNNPKVTKSRR